MKVAGKCPPEKEELENTEKKGFNNTELYLEKKHLDNFEESLRNCQSSDLNINSIHTPHVKPDRTKYFELSDKLASKLDAELVIHTMYGHHNDIPGFEEIGFSSSYGYENNPGISIPHLEEFILDQDHRMVLDTAHLYMTSDHEFFENLNYLLDNYIEQISVIHLCDSTMKEDGLGFGEGDIDMEKLIKVVKQKFDGKVTLEVMPEHQEDALEKWNSIS